jgi:hypothetical protein
MTEIAHEVKRLTVLMFHLHNLERYRRLARLSGRAVGRLFIL